jgi:hypothetical protein
MKGKIFNKEIIYAIPKYVDGQGDISMILNEGGSEIPMPFHIRTLIRKLAYENYIDLVSVRRRLQDQFGQKNILPYPLHPRLILIPVKVRKPRLKKDGAFGYINYVWVEDIQKQDKYCNIIFKNKYNLKVLQHFQGVKAKMLQGAWIQDCFLPQIQYNTNRVQEYQCREELSQIIGQLMDMYKEL